MFFERRRRARTARPGRPRRVVVVGAGPAGSACALALRRGGLAEVVLLERSPAPVDKPCAGGLSPRAVGLLDRLGLRAALEPKAALVTGARLVGPDGTERLLSGRLTALVVRRSVLDAQLAGEAERAGARLERGVSAERLLRDRGRVVGVSAGRRSFEADAVVLAAGAHCRLAWDPRPRTRLDGIVARYEGAEVRPGFVELVFDPLTLPNYAWLFPEPGGTVNVGLCCGHGTGRMPLPSLLDEIVDRRFPALARAKRIGRPRGHPILYSPSARHLVAEGVMVVGEAARLADGFTGEGIWHALRSGLEAASALLAGEPRRYEWRARAVFDPLLAGSELLCRFASSRAFPAATRLSTSAPVSAALSRLLAGFG